VPRRNFHLLWIIAFIALICYSRAGGVYGRQYGPMADAFVTALREIHERCLYNTDERKLFEGAMEGMVEQVKDRNSAYMGMNETLKFREQLGQEFGGIGIEVQWDAETKTLKVLSPIVGTPAYEAGMVSGDTILKINDENTQGFTLADAVDRIKGKKGETVRLTILHEGSKEPIELTIRRATISVDTVLGDVRKADGSWDYVLQEAPEFGYIRITQFGEKTSDEFERALTQLSKLPIKGLILDLRGNPGGLLEAAKDVCNHFLPHGAIIVRTKDREQHIIEEYVATGEAKYLDWPLAVLINNDSASASEIVAACLQDNHRAVIVGERSYGKGTVQTPLELEGGKSMMRLTIAGFWRPNDKNIHRRDDAKDGDVWGVTPNDGYGVTIDEERFLEIAKQRRKRDSLRPAKDGKREEVPVDDPVVDKALEYLRGKAGIRPANDPKAA
jgi:carboxyl-terminal processing protease